MSAEKIAELMARPPKILVVDDDIPLLTLLQDALTRLGCAVITASNGIDALAQLQQPLDGVLLDLRMPHMSGTDLLRAMKDANMKVPVVVVTGYPEENTDELVKTYGVLGVLMKPIDLNELVEALRRYLGIFNVKVASPHECPANP